MSLSKTLLSTLPTCYATVSIGTPEDNLHEKLEVIAAAGFEGIELGFPDLLSFTSKHHKENVQPHDFDALCTAGLQVKDLCEIWGSRLSCCNLSQTLKAGNHSRKSEKRHFGARRGGLE